MSTVITLPNTNTNSDATDDASTYGNRKEKIDFSFNNFIRTFFYLYVPIYTFVIKDIIVLPDRIFGYFIVCLIAEILSYKIWTTILRGCIYAGYAKQIMKYLQMISVFIAIIYTFVVAGWFTENIDGFLKLPFTLETQNLYWLYTYIVFLNFWWYLQLISSIVAIITFILLSSCLCCFSCIKVRQDQVNTQRNIRAMNNATIKTTYNRLQEHFFGIESCLICMSEFKDDDEIRQLSCKHFYHKECIDKWLPEHGTCPNCRSHI
jgi:hypothetical protein